MMRRRPWSRPLEALEALHSSRHVFGPAGQVRRVDLNCRICNAEFATQDAAHPVVICPPTPVASRFR
jgi:taurine dioxygenase